MKLNNGVLVAIEGLDGAGKTTQARMLGERLADLGLRVALTTEPTDVVPGQHTSAGASRPTPEQQFDASVLDRREHVSAQLVPQLEAGAVVIVDRYYVSSIAHEGARGVDPQLIRAVNEDFAPVPDIVFLLEISPEQALKRRDALTNTGNEEIEELREAAAIFSALPDEELHIVRLDARAPIDALHQRICRQLHAGPMFHASCKKGDKLACEPYCGLRELCAFPELRPLAPHRFGDPGAA